MKRYDSIIFDWDGCLADTIPYWTKFFEIILKELGYVWDKKEINRYLVHGKQRAKSIGVSEKEFQKAHDLALKKYDVSADISNSSLNPNVLSTIKQLQSKNIKMSIITGSPIENLVIPVLKREGIIDLFYPIMGKYQSTISKPHPTIIRQAISEMKTTKESTLVVGDSDKDIQMAKGISIESVIYYPKKRSNYYDRDYLSSLSPLCIINDFEELLKYAKGMK